MSTFNERNEERLKLVKNLTGAKLVTRKVDPHFYFIETDDSFIEVSAVDGIVLYYESPFGEVHELINEFHVDDKLRELASKES